MKKTLGGVTANLLDAEKRTVAFVDFQFGAASAKLLRDGMTDQQRSLILNSLAIQGDSPQHWVGENSGDPSEALCLAARKIREQSGSSIGIAIGPFLEKQTESLAETYPVAISFAEGETIQDHYQFAGHSSMRDIRSANQVVNFLRLTLMPITPDRWPKKMQDRDTE